MTDDFIKSNEFLSTYEWRELRQKVFLKYGNYCMCCGAKAKDDVYLCVDHIKPRKKYPELALDLNNLSILCNSCNHGKANWHSTDWGKDDTFIITRKWFDSNRRCMAGINAKQLAVLGEVYPPKSGWKDRFIGKRITEQQKLEFEQAKHSFVESTYMQHKRNKRYENNLKKEKQQLLSEQENLRLQIELEQLRLDLSRLQQNKL